MTKRARRHRKRRKQRQMARRGRKPFMQRALEFFQDHPTPGDITRATRRTFLSSKILGGIQTKPSETHWMAADGR